MFESWSLLDRKTYIQGFSGNAELVWQMVVIVEYLFE
jgi:hypothetical protein